MLGVSKVFAELGANVVRVNHERNADSEKVNSCILRLQAETKNDDHIAAIKEELTKRGFKLVDYTL